MNKMITYIYCRLSSKSQLYNNNQSLYFQKTICYNFCIKKKYNINSNNIISEIMRANNIKKLKIYDLLNNHKNIRIIVKDVSRLSRNIKDINIIFDLCKKNNIDIQFVNDDITINDVNKFKSLVELANIESNQISKRLKKTFDYKKMINSHHGKPKFGFYNKKFWDKKNKVYKIILKKNEQEYKIIKKIKHLKKNNTIKDIVKIFNDKNILNKIWTYHKIYHILNKNNVK